MVRIFRLESAPTTSFIKGKGASWFNSLFNITDRLFTGRKPPEEIKDIAKLNESKDLILIKFNIKKIIKVKPV